VKFDPVQVLCLCLYSVLEPSRKEDLSTTVNPQWTSGMTSSFDLASFPGSNSLGIASDGICDRVATLFCFKLTPKAPERRVHTILH
jgi:hypothetical protein